MNNDIQIFDRTLLKLKRERSVKRFDDYDFLFRWSAEQIHSRLQDIKRDFPTVAQLGARGGKLIQQAITCDLGTHFSPDIIADEEFLPFADDSLDMLISNLSLHAVNDLPGTLIQINRALKADGLFLGAMFGGETLFELRDSFAQTEMTLKNGMSPRVFPFADKQDLGALMQRAGFALPVVDSDIVTVTYETMFKLMDDLRGMGEGNIIAARDKAYVGKNFFMEAARHYAENHADPDGRIRASFEIIFLIGWAPHDSQQKPLRPGSAQERLADALKTEEEAL